MPADRAVMPLALQYEPAAHGVGADEPTGHTVPAAQTACKLMRRVAVVSATSR
jgi:hypothetical protein